MRISDVLRAKGGQVVTLPPDTPVRELVAALKERGIGATVVSSDGASVAGIVSERDVVRALAERGESVLGSPIAEIMTSDVHACGPEASVDDVMRLMTNERVRHVPVLVDGSLRGIVSIGDVVKNRISELEMESRSLAGYISSSGS